MMAFSIFLIIFLTIPYLTGLLGNKFMQNVENSSIYCILPEKPENGNYKILGENSLVRITDLGKMVPSGIALKYSCKSKKYALDRKPIILCRNKYWYPSIPVCNKKCQHIKPVTSTATCKYNGKPTVCTQLLKHHTVVKYACKAKHYSREFIRSRTCIDGTWDYPTPKCIQECGEENYSGLTMVDHQKRTFPWHVGIYSIYSLHQDSGKYVQICGGTIIRANIILSAASCFFNEETGKSIDKYFFKVAAGNYFKELENTLDEKNVQISTIAAIVMPDQYGGSAQQHQSDIALLKLVEPFNFSSSVLAVCIDLFDELFDREQLSANNLGKLSSWRVSPEDFPASEYLKTVDIPVVSYNECKNKVPKSFRRYITSDKYCAGYLNGTSVCPGDSGGGMVFQTQKFGYGRWYLRGIVSVVPKTQMNKLVCSNDLYSTFTRLFSHRDWILEKLAEYE